MNYRDIINNRKVAFGEPDRLMSMALNKYPWANDIYETMEANTWFPKAIGMGDDKLHYKTKLSDKERLAYDRALAFASNLDGIQFNNLVHNIGHYITDPMVSLCIARQAAEEGVHVRAYQTMVEAVSLNPEDVYMMFQKDGILAEKNSFIMRQSDLLKETGDKTAFARALVSNLSLEGVYFYSVFLLFYALARDGKMLASADQIRYINRDEGGTHLELFANILATFKQENPEIDDDEFKEDAKYILKDAAALEIKWGKYLIQGGMLGLTEEGIELYIQYLTNRCAALAGLPAIFPGVKNPYPWVEDYSQVNGGRSNFFERKPTDYDVSGALDWE